LKQQERYLGMGDDSDDKPQLPDKFRLDFLVESVDRDAVNLLMDWLKETSEKTGHSIECIFAEQADKILERELGREERHRRRKEYEKKQSERLIKYLDYLEENGIDIDSDPGLNEL
jgi:hypothetical protein